MEDPRQNNFDLLRLFAASQVLYFHTVENLQIPVTMPFAWISRVLELFPGVPIFFTISGFLISMSYKRSRSLRDYCLNRFLRIYPALWVCFGATLLALTAFRVWDRVNIPASKLLIWTAMQLTIGQFYSPYVINAAYGVGHANGSLWTIPVELQFYAALPIVYFLLRPRRKAAADVAILLLATLFFATEQAYAAYGPGLSREHEDVMALAHVSFVPWICMFLIGVFLQRSRSWVMPALRNKGLLWLPSYLVLAYPGFPSDGGIRSDPREHDQSAAVRRAGTHGRISRSYQTYAQLTPAA